MRLLWSAERMWSRRTDRPKFRIWGMGYPRPASLGSILPINTAQVPRGRGNQQAAGESVPPNDPDLHQRVQGERQQAREAEGAGETGAIDDAAARSRTR